MPEIAVRGAVGTVYVTPEYKAVPITTLAFDKYPVYGSAPLAFAPIDTADVEVFTAPVKVVVNTLDPFKYKLTVLLSLTIAQ